jgi:hypothetical protein
VVVAVQVCLGAVVFVQYVFLSASGEPDPRRCELEKRQIAQKYTAVKSARIFTVAG